MMHSETLNER